MARRKRNEGVMDLLFELPWWATLVLGLLLFAFSAGGSSNPVALLIRLFAYACFVASFVGAIKTVGRMMLFASANDIDAIRAMSWREFETLVAESYRRQGYQAEETGGGGSDGGVDVILRGRGQRILVQCKQWKTFKVGVKIVREMYGIMTAEGADRVVIVTSGTYTQEAVAFARGKPIELMDGRALVQLIREVKGTSREACTRSGSGGPHDLRRRLRRTAYEGLGRLYGIKDPGQPANPFERALARRLADELTAIEHAGAADAFLTVSDLVAHARAQGIPVGPGRGGAAGSLAAYALGITGVDPVRFNLVSELFLNTGRASPPHFELDLCQARRGEVVLYLASRYGPERVARTAIFSRFTAKSAIRDVARALGVPQSKAARLAAMVPDPGGAPPMTVGEARASWAAFDAVCSADADMRRIAQIAEVVTGLCRGVGVHAAALAIGDRPLADLVPLTFDTAGNAVTQFAKAQVAACGLLTIDLLGLRTLTALQEAAGLVQRRRSVELDLAQLPLDDPETCRLLSRGDTAGVFQADSDGVRELMREGGVAGIEDLVAILTLYRPAAMAMIPAYLARKQGREPADCGHPLLEPVLRETYGLILYQEQILHAVHALAGYPLCEADLLRRAICRKGAAAVPEERARFVDACARVSRIPADRPEPIFDRIAASAGSAFCKAHAVAYGIITYQAAYMKAHYPEEFLYAQHTCEDR